MPKEIVKINGGKMTDLLYLGSQVGYNKAKELIGKEEIEMEQSKKIKRAIKENRSSLIRIGNSVIFTIDDLRRFGVDLNRPQIRMGLTDLKKTNQILKWGTQRSHIVWITNGEMIDF